jgi:hypothetical protein
MSQLIETIRAELAPPPEINETTLNERQMAGFAEGYALAAEDPLEQMTQRTFDLSVAFIDPECPDVDVAIGSFIGYVRYFQELLCQVEEAESEVEVAELLIMAAESEEVH